MNLIEQQSKEFQSRHIGTSEAEMNEMLHLTGEKISMSWLTKLFHPISKINHPCNCLLQ